jgi:hypothetical protein
MKCIWGKKLKFVAMDRSVAYAQSVREHAPHTIITFDRFHVMKMMNERLDDLGRELVCDAETEDQGRVIKGTRWLLLRRAGTLDLMARSNFTKPFAFGPKPPESGNFCKGSRFGADSIPNSGTSIDEEIAIIPHGRGRLPRGRR